MKSESDYLEETTKVKWYSINAIKGKGDYLWKYDRAKVTFLWKDEQAKVVIWPVKSEFIWKDDHAIGIIFWKVETARVIIFEKMTEWKWLSRAKGWKGAAQPVVPPKNIASWFWFRIQ